MTCTATRRSWMPSEAISRPSFQLVRAKPSVGSQFTKYDRSTFVKWDSVIMMIWRNSLFADYRFHLVVRKVLYGVIVGTVPLVLTLPPTLDRGSEAPRHF
jgi:hypothetical protein